ncbi:ankyrin repeat-containing protein ITN1-like [Senna tora]|uniref:Ankyrin repeat-containing protein ITN1-like n=1 Tax=Senna tora TaxID=362788 RepID=A0A835CJH3_9FABA|nr:ankyrin repeat-containing protein ITN1-like [Senna tora]
MSTSYQHSDDMSGLYEASSIGCVDTLNQLLHQNPQILHKISLTSFTETPLHISSLFGHLDFTKALLSHKPQLALELDSSRSTPLHLASAEGHIQIVKELVKVKANREACLFPNEEGRIPLHYAAMRGRVEIAKELIRAKAESLSLHDNNGNNVLHFCVMYNHLETLKALVELEPQRSGEILNNRTFDGKNTILHLAVMFKQLETVRYLLSMSKIRAAARETGFTLHETLDRSPKDMKSLQIQVTLMKYGIKPESKEIDETQPPQTTTSDNICNSILKRIGNCYKIQDKDEWLKEMRGNLSLVAIMMSTISFQAVVNPPVGLTDQLQLSSSSSSSSSSLYSTHHRQKNPFLFSNTMSFVSSLSVALLLVSGFSLKNKVVMWVISLGMCVALTFLAIAYLYATSLNYGYDSNWVMLVFLAWIGLLLIITMLNTIRFFIWIVKISVRAVKLVVRQVKNQNGCCCFV